MRKFLILLLSILSVTAFSQKKKVAVYVIGKDPNWNSAVESHLKDNITHSDKYENIERDAIFLEELSKEYKYQSTGAVDDQAISKIGKHHGVDYVCVASIFDVWGSEKYISARMIDVESAEVIMSSSTNGTIANSPQLKSALNNLSKGLLSSFEESKLSNAKKVAVYVTRTGNKDIDIILGDQLVAGFATSGRYLAIERTQGFLNKLGEEQNYQRTGAVDDNELSRLGKQFGVDYVCVTRTSQLFGDYFISTRLIDVETASVVNSHNIEGVYLSNSYAVLSVAKEIATKLSGRTVDEERAFQAAEARRIEQERKYQEEQDRLRREQQAEAERQRIAREKEAKIQAKINRPWTDLLEDVGDNVSFRYRDDLGWYIGRWCDNKCGMGINYYHRDYETYLDCGWWDGFLDGYGMRVNILGNGIYNTVSSVFAYVGDWKNGKKSGEGALYNKNGKLIYYGKFFNDKPTEQYVSDNSYDSYTFEVINYPNGDKYIGELQDGKKHGQGLYIWESGDVWYGEWDNDQRYGHGIYAWYSGKYKTGKIINNQFVE